MNATSDQACETSFERAIFVAAPVEILWTSLTDPLRMAQWMGDDAMPVFVHHEERVGSSIVVRGRQHVPFESRGRILAWTPTRRFTWTHLSTLSNLPDEPANYTTLDFALAVAGDGSTLEFTMAGFPTLIIRKHLVLYWDATLGVLRRHAEAHA